MKTHIQNIRELLLTCKRRLQAITLWTHGFYFIAVILEYWAVWSIIRLYVPISTRPSSFLSTWLILSAITGGVWLAVLLTLMFAPGKILPRIDERLGLKDTLTTAFEQYKNEPSEWDLAIYRECCEKFSLKEFKRAFRFRIPGKACLMVVTAIAIFVLSYQLPYQAWRNTSEVRQFISRFEQRVTRLEYLLRGASVNLKEKAIIERIKRLSDHLTAQGEATDEAILDMYRITTDYRKMAESRQNQGSSKELLMDRAFIAVTTAQSKHTTVGAYSKIPLLKSLEAMSKYAAALETEIVMRPVNTSIVESIEDQRESEELYDSGLRVGSDTRASLANEVAKPSKLPLSEKEDLTIGDLSIENQPVPWEKIPLWQEKVVKNYFSNE